MRKYWMALIAGILAWNAAAFSQEPDPAGQDIVAVLQVEGALGPGAAEYLSRGFDEAEKRGAKLIVLRMDTPGGLASSMRDVVQRILASPIPVASYISPTGARAASAGTYIFYASHVAAMAPSTYLGAATPVTLGGFGSPARKDKDDDSTETTDDAMKAKAVNDAVAYLRGLAELRGRNAAWAERAVREAATLTASQAVGQDVADFIARDLNDLLRQADGRKVRVLENDVELKIDNIKTVSIEPDWRAQLLAAITNPNIAYLLLLAGIYGLLFEFISPGAIFPGVVGAISLVVGLYALNLLPINYAGMGLLLVGVALMVAEAFLPSFGALGIGGIVAFALGSLFLFPAETPWLRISPPVVVAVTLGSAAFLVIAVGAVWRAHQRNTVTGEVVLLGGRGRVLHWENGEGEIHVHGERWHARSGSPLGVGQRVRVVERENLTLLVEPEADDQSNI